MHNLVLKTVKVKVFFKILDFYLCSLILSIYDFFGVFIFKQLSCDFSKYSKTC